MLFPSLTFLLFLPLVFGLYWSVRGRHAQNVVVVAASYLFYGWWDWRFCSLMLISTVVDYLVGIGLGHCAGRRRRIALLVISLSANLGMLGFFKYFDFFADSLTRLLGTFGVQASWTSLNIVLPVGISFYTFQTLSYTIDIFRRRIQPTHDPLAFAAYVCFFPQLVAGPIERADRLLPQFLQARRFEFALARQGCRLMLWGFFMKMVLADNLGTVVDPIYRDLADSRGPQLIIATVCFAFQILCDFGGYSLIAIGTARLFGVRLCRNFAHPYFSQDVAEFWRRWHISLSTWFRDYLYIPLGGSRVARLRQAFNVLLTFTISGLWHGASWHFVLWGLLNGIGILPVIFTQNTKRPVDHVPGGSRNLPAAGTLIRILATFTFICITWVLFRVDNIGQAWTVFGKFATDSLSPADWRDAFDAVASTPITWVLPVALGYFIIASWLSRGDVEEMQLTGWPTLLRWTYYTVLVFALILYGTVAGSGFIYFQF